MILPKRSNWLDVFPYEESIKILADLALSHAAEAGPFSDFLCGVIRNRDWALLLDWKCEYVPGLNPSHLIHARQALAFFEKFEPLIIPEAKSKTLTAFHNFAQSEITCGLVNQRFRNYRTGVPMGYPYDVILTDARSHVQAVLGECPALNELHLSYGPGAQTNLKKNVAMPRSKLGANLQCSNELAIFIGKLMETLPALCIAHSQLVECTSDGELYEYEYEVVPGRLQFVPKDAKKYRSIVVEPGLNTLLQQGIGRAIRKRLMKRGINLNDQGINRRLAQEGSLTNQLATIDFSSASDTISKGLVDFLLPTGWDVLLSVARTGRVEYNGLLIPLEKFSSMGNSFTFELESLIFYSLAWAVRKFLGVPGKLSIYGDDLILPSECVALANLVFAFCGFTINEKKSFSDGPFRESCGADFYLGLDIRPYYQKDLVTGESLFVLHNFYVRTGDLVRASKVLQLLHPSLIRFGPNGYGDGHLIGSWTGGDRYVKLAGTLSIKDRRKLRASALGWEGTFFTTYRHRNASCMTPNSGDQLLPVYSIYMKDEHVREDWTSLPDSPQKGDMWADSGHFVTPGSDGYELVSIYTTKTSVF